MPSMSLALLGDDPDAFYLHRLTQRLLLRQRAYKVREDYAIGNHPPPNGDPRYAQALQYLQRMSTTNYVALALSAVVDRMRVRTFKFAGEVDEDAMKIWKANNMAMNSQIAISTAAMLSDVYALVSPPREDDPNGLPVITIEDPRVCIVEPDPQDPLKAIVGMKFYEDTVYGVTVAILYFPDRVTVYQGPSMNDFLAAERTYSPENIVASSGGFTKIYSVPNPVGVVPLIRGPWRPQYGLLGMAECEDGGWDIQDRINKVILDRLVVAQHQAYRQRWVTGAKSAKGTGSNKGMTFDPGSDMLWAVTDPDANFGDFEQADIEQHLNAAEADIGDFAALTQTPVMYLTNKLVNVSGDTMAAAQAALISKTKTRMEIMGWFFEQIIKLCFLYMGDTTRATDVEAETLWIDPELRTMAEQADFVSKMAAASPGFLRIAAERIGLTPEEVEFVMEEHERMSQQEQEANIALAEASSKPMMGPGGKPTGGSQGNGGSKPAAKGQSKSKSEPKSKPKPKAK